MLIRRGLLRRRKDTKLGLVRRIKPKLVSPSLYADNPWYWRYIAGDSSICYVCDRMIIGATARKTMVYIGRHPFNGARIHRHFHCHPQTTKWQRKFGEREYFYNRIQKWKERKNAKADAFESIPSSLQSFVEKWPRIIRRTELGDTNTSNTRKKSDKKGGASKLIKRRKVHS